MGTILLVIILILVFGGGGGYYAHGRYGFAGLAAFSAWFSQCSWCYGSFERSARETALWRVRQATVRRDWRRAVSTGL